MGTIDSYCIIHIERCQTSKGKITNAMLTVNRPLWYVLQTKLCQRFNNFNITEPSYS